MRTPNLSTRIKPKTSTLAMALGVNSSRARAKVPTCDMRSAKPVDVELRRRQERAANVFSLHAAGAFDHLPICSWCHSFTGELGFQDVVSMGPPMPLASIRFAAQ